MYLEFLRGLYKLYKSYKSKTNSFNAKGTGKIQKWVETLSGDKLNSVKNDIDKLSVRKFKAKWNKDKRLVVKYLDIN